jgi:hypothetical protein
MQVDQETAIGGDLAQCGDAAGAVGHGALEVGDTADDIHAEVKRAAQQLDRTGVTIIAVLRESDELKIDVGRDAFLNLE